MDFPVLCTMEMYMAALNSGSNGNCYYVGNGRDAVLIDAGISCRETERRMIRMGLPLGHVRAIVISHEHTDHTRGAEVLSKKYGIPVYITERTLRGSRLRIPSSMVCFFGTGETIPLGDLSVKAFSKWHDAADPHSFNVSCNGTTVGVYTDIGTACDQVSDHLRECDALFLESNYDPGMLENGRYPLYLKRRISGAEGHLSNEQALDLFLSCRSERLKLLVLAHLSAENNHPALVHGLFSRHAGNTRIEIATRHNETEVFRVTPRWGK